MSTLISVRELAALALPTGTSREGLLLMLRAYFDDSGTDRDSKVTAVGGLIGTVRQWEVFEAAWAARLADPLPPYGKPALKMFHLSHCNARDGEFSGYSQGECDAVMHDFRQILIDSRLFATASMVDKAAYDEMIVGPLRDWLGEGVDVCVENCMSEVIKIAGTHPEGANVAVVLDRGMWTPRMREIVEEYTLSMLTPRIVSVAFSAVRDVLPLQGADIVATENYWHGNVLLQGGNAIRPHMRHYLQNMFAEGFMVGRPQLAEKLADLEDALRQSVTLPTRPAE